MKITISFKHLEHTPSLDEKIRLKSQKFKKFLGGNVTLHWTCSVHNKEHQAEIKLSGPTFGFHATATSDDLYKSLDLVVMKMAKQLEKKKSVWKNKMHQKDGKKEINKIELFDYEDVA